jgi:TRAP transporter TAXI family solute receptor
MRARALAIVLVVLLTAACGTAAVNRPPTPVRIATSDRPLGDALARIYTRQIPGVHATVGAADTSRFNLRAIEVGDSDVGFVRADLAYAAHSQGTPLHPEPHRRLRGIAVVGRSLLHIVVRTDSSAQTLADLRGKPIGTRSPSASARRRMAVEGNRGIYGQLLVASGAMTAEAIEFIPMAPRDLMDALDQGAVAGALSLTGSETSALSRTAPHHAGLRPIDIAPDVALRIRAQHQFFKPALIPAGTYDGQQDDVRTIGVDTLLVCRGDLSEDVVYALVKAFFASLPELMDASELIRGADPDFAPATPIALHPGAARYYREQELPHY